MKKYVNNQWAKNPEKKLMVGNELISGDSFDYETMLYTYHVTYKNVGNGVIAYEYTVERNGKPTGLEVDTAVVAVIVVAVLLTFIIITYGRTLVYA